MILDQRSRATRVPGVLCILALIPLVLPKHAACADLPPAEEICKLARVSSGFCVHLDCDGSSLVKEIAKTGRFLVHGITSDEASAAALRKELMTARLSGLASIESLTLKRLPYTKNMVDLLVASDLAGLRARGVTLAEMVRVLSPRGSACLGKAEAGKKEIEEELKKLGITQFAFKGATLIFTKPRPEGMDDWSHARHGPDGNAVSRDTTLGVPNHLQWVAGPTRSYHRLNFGPIASRPGRLLSAGGRNFYQQGRNIVARNAFNGILLWVKPINTSLGRMIASEKYFYTCPKDEIHAYDALTGEKAFSSSEKVKCSSLMLVDGLLISAGADGIKAFAAGTVEKKWTCPQSVGGAIADQQRIFFGSSKKLTCISLKDGKQLWSKDVSGDVGEKSGLKFAFNGMLCFVGSADGVLEAAILKGKDGTLAWKARNNQKKGMVFSAGGLFWMEHTAVHAPEGKVDPKKKKQKISKWVGHDPATGKVAQTHPGPVTLPYACHPFYPSDRYWIGNRPVYFMDWKTGEAFSFEGTRIQCGSAYFLGQGMFFGLYTTPNKCMCMPTAMCGTTAFASIGEKPNLGEVPIQEEGRFVKGDAQAPQDASPSAWPMYRCDYSRTSSVGVRLPGSMKMKWRRRLVESKNHASVINHDWPVSKPIGDRITAPTASRDRVFAGLFHDHRIVAIDIKTGEVAWAFDTSSRVDTPPAIYRGMCLFADHNGWVYCVREDNGKLIWKFRAAPADQRMIAYGQIESSWPVVGGVLMVKDTAYVVAGRTAEVDGGLYVHALEPETGKLKWTTRLRKKLLGQFGSYSPRYTKGLGFTGPSDILVSEGTMLSMRGSNRGRVNCADGSIVQSYSKAIPFGWHSSRFHFDKFGVRPAPITYIGPSQYTVWSSYANRKRGDIQKYGKGAWKVAVPGSRSVEALASISGRAAVRNSARRPVARVPVVEKAPVIDGELDAAFKQKATPLSFAFLDGQRKAPKESTTAYLLCDKENLYLGFHCQKKRKGILCKKTKRDDAIWQDEAMEMYIDPKNQRSSRYFHIIVNSAGVLQDSFAGKKSWNGNISAAAKKQDLSWTAEVKIPFKELGVEPGDLKKIWSFNLTRSARDPNNKAFLEDTAWAPTGEKSSHVPGMFGYIWLDSAQGGPDDAQFAAWFKKTAPKTQRAPVAETDSGQKPAAARMVLKNPAVRVETASGVVVDGKIDAAYRKKSTPLKLSYLNGSGGDPAEPTAAYLLSDKQHLYLAFECQKKDTRNIVTRQKVRDKDVWKDEVVEIFLDPKNKRDTSYYHIIVNSAGVIQDSKNKSDASWNADIKAACSRTEKAWIVEVQIPFKDLDIKDGQLPHLWSINLNRSARDAKYPSAVEDTAWSPTGTSSSHVPAMFGYMWLNAGTGGSDAAAYKKWHEGLPRIEKKAAAKTAKGSDLIIAAVANSKGSVERGGELWILSAESGEKVGTYPLPAAPAHDGLAITENRVFVTLQDTTVVCFEGVAE